MIWAEAFKEYLEIGFLGLCGVLVIVMFYRFLTKSQTDDTKKDETIKEKDKVIEDRFDQMINILQEYQKSQTKDTEAFITSIVNGVTTHTTPRDENKKLTQVTEKLNDTLKQMLIDTKADRAYVVQYHNGGRGINKQSFLKMSITNEEVQIRN